MKGMLGDSPLGKVVAGCVLVVAVGFGLMPQQANASTVDVAGGAGSDVAVAVSSLYASTPVWKGEPEPIVTVTGEVGVVASDTPAVAEPIVTVDGGVGVGTSVTTNPSSGSASGTPVVDASPRTVTPEPVAETPVVPVPVAPVADAQPETETETVASSEPGVGVGDAVVIVPDPVTDEPIQLTEVFECYYGDQLLKVAYNFNGCDDVFASLPVVEGDAGAVGGGGWVKRIVLTD